MPSAKRAGGGRGGTGGAGRLRVIAGDLRGRRLLTLPGDAVRPTAERVREALFDILGGLVSGCTFLDAYAGTGAVGIEALSRGAASVTFVEKEPTAVDRLMGNLDRAGAPASRTRVLPIDLGKAIPLLEAGGASFDIVYVDPPYAGGELDRALRLLARARLLAPGAPIVAEHESGAPAPEPEGLVATRHAVYGRAALTFFARRGAR